MYRADSTKRLSRSFFGVLESLDPQLVAALSILTRDGEFDDSDRTLLDGLLGEVYSSVAPIIGKNLSQQDLDRLKSYTQINWRELVKSD